MKLLYFLLALLPVWLFGVIVVQRLIVGVVGRVLDWMDPYD